MQMNSEKKSCQSLRRFGSVVALLATAMLSGCNDDDHADNSNISTSILQATWVAAPVDSYILPKDGSDPFPQDTVENQTLRHIMRITTGGDGVRIRVSNRFGTQPLKIGSMYVARSLGQGLIDTSTNIPLKFNGETVITIPAGQEIWSDVVAMNLPNDIDLAISMFIPEKASTETMHSGTSRPFFVANGNATLQADLAEGKFPVNGKAPHIAIAPSYWITGIDVQNSTARGVIVTIGDSITDGTATFNALKNYPNFLANRVINDNKLAGYSVVNSGIAGNQLLREGLSIGLFGERLLNRFERDALNVTGVTHIVVLIGINDIGGGVTNPTQASSVEELQAGLQELVDKAKAKNIKIFLATVLPFEGAFYYAEEAEVKRQALNSWIRANNARANGIIDFDAALRDPVNPKRMLEKFDSGDHLHPSDGGYKAMANAVDLKLFY